jgi:2-haloacid dehalogenase
VKRRPLEAICACVFDAYGTLFDVGSVAQCVRVELPDRWQALSELWRAKQLQYTWLRSLAGQHADFWQVTGEALDFALGAFEVQDRALRERLMDGYLRILAYPDVPPALARLKSRGLQLAVLSNGTPGMLDAALANARIAAQFDAVLSVEDAGIYKPHPRVYELAPRRLGLPRERICFVSSNGWDAWSAKAFGFRVLWCNRTGQAAERLPAEPDGQIADLAELSSWLID